MLEVTADLQRHAGYTQGIVCLVIHRQMGSAPCALLTYAHNRRLLLLDPWRLTCHHVCLHKRCCWRRTDCYTCSEYQSTAALDETVLPCAMCAVPCCWFCSCDCISLAFHPVQQYPKELLSYASTGSITGHQALLPAAMCPSGELSLVTLPPLAATIPMLLL